MRLTAADLVNQISQLDTTIAYNYISGAARVQITHIQKPEGPIRFVRYMNNGSVSRGSISRQQLAHLAFICSNRPNHPLHIDRIFSAGGNSRSALETLLAYTSHFFVCYPARMDVYSGDTKQDLKHIMWCPDDNHPIGVLTVKEYQQIITEVELGVDYGNIQITPANLGTEFDTIEAKTTHTQMQVALIAIGRALNFKTWVACNDRSIAIGTTQLGQLQGVVQSLEDIRILYDDEIKTAAALIDCIWFTEDHKRIPAIMEIEHSTGVTSGLTRMLKLRETFPAIATTFTIVAPNNLRNKVVSEANQPIFKSLKARFMPYSTVRELYGLIQRYTLSNVVDYRFIEPFMEIIVED